MPGMAAKVVITERQQLLLQTMAFSRCCPRGLAHRAEIILLAFDGCVLRVSHFRPSRGLHLIVCGPHKRCGERP